MSEPIGESVVHELIAALASLEVTPEDIEHIRRHIESALAVYTAEREATMILRSIL